MIYYVGIPLTILTISIARPVWRWRGGKDNLGLVLLASTLLFLPMYLFAYTGGV